MDRSRATDRDEVERFLATLAYVKVHSLFRCLLVLVVHEYTLPFLFHSF